MPDLRSSSIIQYALYEWRCEKVRPLLVTPKSVGELLHDGRRLLESRASLLCLTLPEVQISQRCLDRPQFPRQPNLFCERRRLLHMFNCPLDLTTMLIEYRQRSQVRNAVASTAPNTLAIAQHI